MFLFIHSQVPSAVQLVEGSSWRRWTATLWPEPSECGGMVIMANCTEFGEATSD